MPSFTAEGYAHERVSELLDLAERDETIALVNMGRSVTVLSIIQNKQLLFERDIPLAGQDLTRAILISYRKESTPRTTNDLDSSESLKRSSVIPVSGLGSTMTLMEPEENQKVYHAMEGILNAWVHDIRLSLHTFEEKFPSKKISRFYIMGGGANLNNLTGYLGSELGVDIELLKFPEGKFKLPTTPSPEPFKEKFHEYATALALAMHRDKHAILTPEELFAGRIERMGQVALRIAPILLGGLLLTWFLFLNSSIHYLSEIKGILGQERLLLSRVEKPYLEMVRWERFLHEADSQTLPASNILKAISRHIPSNLLLSQLSFDRDSRTVMMDGFVYGDVKDRAITMTEFSKVLADTTHFQKVEVDRLQSLTGEEEAGLFRLRAELVEFKKA